MFPFTALLCLGLSVGVRTPVQAGILPRPTLWAEPGSMVSQGGSVTLWCQGTLKNKKYFLEGSGTEGNWTLGMVLVSGDKAMFLINKMDIDQSGLYYCKHCGSLGCSEYSDELELVITGLYSKPSLTALPRPVVASGGNVTLQCGSPERFQGFILTWQGETEFSLVQESQPHPNWQFQALFPVDLVNPGHNWTFTCYGYFEHPRVRSHPSDSLQLLVSGTSRRPFLLSPQGPITTPGQNLTLQCCSEVGYDTFALSKEGSHNFLYHTGQNSQAGISQADFLLGPVNDSHGGRYRCLGRHGLTSLWSEPSEPLDILVADELPYTSFLLVQPGPSVSPGENVTLLCRSGGWRDTYLLTKEGMAYPLLRVRAEPGDGMTQGQFFFHPVTSEQSGTYRCYSSHSIRPYQLSHPSAPLKLWVSGAAATMSPTQHTLHSISSLSLSSHHPHDFSTVNLIWVLLGGAVLLFLGILLLEVLLSQYRNWGRMEANKVRARAAVEAVEMESPMGWEQSRLP